MCRLPPNSSALTCPVMLASQAISPGSCFTQKAEAGTFFSHDSQWALRSSSHWGMWHSGQPDRDCLPNDLASKNALLRHMQGWAHTRSRQPGCTSVSTHMPLKFLTKFPVMSSEYGFPYSRTMINMSSCVSNRVSRGQVHGKEG